MANQLTYKGKSLDERFWSLVDKGGEDECWNWKGSTHTREAYGYICIEGKTVVAHRMAWELEYGALGSDDKLYHACGNRYCMNPRHLRRHDPATWRFANRPRRTIETRFWGYVDKRGPDECWEWQGPLHAKGYGMLSCNGRLKRAHRLSWEFAYGPIPKGDGHNGTCVCHKCDNRKCVNPNHLFLGTDADNVHDMVDKGRAVFPRGEQHGGAKLDWDKVREIRRLPYAPAKTLAEKFGVGTNTIWVVRKGHHWKDEYAT